MRQVTIAGCVLALSGLGAAQTVIYDIDENVIDAFTTSLASFGDIDGDGFDDFGFVSSHLSQPLPPEAFIVSGATGTPFYTVATTLSQIGIGEAGDANNDGRPDVVLVDLGVDITLRSGVTGSVLHTITDGAGNFGFGFAFGAAGDFNGDGHDDVAVTDMSDPQFSGRVIVYSGKDATKLYDQLGTRFGEAFGRALAPAGDVNTDGFDDLIVGAPGNNAFDPTNPGRVFVVSGKDGSVLRTYMGTVPGGQFGASVSGNVDVDGDGTRDVIVGVPNVGPPTAPTGRVVVISGATGATLHSIDGTLPFLGYLGVSVAGVGDLNGDTRAEFAAGEIGADPGGLPLAGRIVVFDGLTGQERFSGFGDVANMRLGMRVAAGDDVNGDGVPDVVAISNKAPAVKVFSGTPMPLFADEHVVSAAVGGTIEFQVAAGPAFAGDFYGLVGSTSGTQPGFPLGGVVLPVNPSDAYFRFVTTNPNFPPFQNNCGVLDGAGSATVPWTLPAGTSASVVGLTAHHAYVVVDAATGASMLASNAIPLVIDS